MYVCMCVYIHVYIVKAHPLATPQADALELKETVAQSAAAAITAGARAAEGEAREAELQVYVYMYIYIYIYS